MRGGYPFYDQWNIHEIQNYKIYVHKDQDFYKYSNQNKDIIMIGHAYNPFDMKYKEEELLEDAINAYDISDEKFFEKISEFTGIHLITIFDGNKLICVQDSAGIKSCFFGKIDDNIYITSHTQLVADICNLKMDEFIQKLVKTKCYNIGNRYLPGNTTTYKELKRLGSNTYLEYKNDDFTIKRFYPIKPHKEIKDDKEFNDTIDKIIEIIRNNCLLSIKKWNRPAISLSGGMDSKTTLACCNGLYDKFKIYSFHCKKSELLDANAAHKICEEIGQPHEIYEIPSKNEEIENFYIMKKIINHNTAYMLNLAEHEIRKYIFLYNNNIDIDIELKSWVSEIGRAFYESKYGFSFPEILNERQYNIFQTRYFLHPILMRKGDKIWANFIKEVGLENKLYNYEHADLCFWEIRMGSWGPNVISSLDIGNKVTMPFNNRNLMEMLLTFDHNTRKQDLVHKNIIKKANSTIYNMNLTIHNASHKSYRVMIEKIYYKIRTAFYKSKI